MSDRVAYPKLTRLSAGADIEAAIEPSIGHGRRFSLTVAEEALQQIGPEVIPHIVEKLAEQIAREQRGSVEATVHEYLRNRAWAEPIIREAIREAVHTYVRGMMASRETP